MQNLKGCWRSIWVQDGKYPTLAACPNQAIDMTDDFVPLCSIHFLEWEKDQAKAAKKEKK